MSGFDYDAMARKALKLIERFGMAVTLKKLGTTPSTLPWEPAGSTEQVFPGRGVMGAYDKSSIDGTSIHREDIKLLLASSGLGAAPAKGDMIEAVGVNYNVITTRPLSPGGVAVLYEVQLRR